MWPLKCQSSFAKVARLGDCFTLWSGKLEKTLQNPQPSPPSFKGHVWKALETTIYIHPLKIFTWNPHKSPKLKSGKSSEPKSPWLWVPAVHLFKGVSVYICGFHLADKGCRSADRASNHGYLPLSKRRCSPLLWQTVGVFPGAKSCIS